MRHLAGTIADQPSTAGRPLCRRVADVPNDDRPRERLARLGSSALTNAELLAVLIGSGSRKASALDLGDRLSRAGLRRLAGCSVSEIEVVGGLGRAKATRVLAALELGARLSSAGETHRQFPSPEAAASYLLPRYGPRPVEHFGILALDTRGRLRAECLLSVGSLSGSLVHPREVFAAAINARAAGIILFHNHPSGDPEPSAEDLGLSRRLAGAGSLMGIEVLDHLVLGDGRFVSLKARGVL